MKNKIGAIITAGGNSTRFGSNKLLETIEGKTIIETTISKFIDIVDFIVIPAKDDVKEVVSKSFLNKIIFAPAGKTRQQSVYNAIKMCPDDTKILLIHDSARPFIDVDDIKKVIDLTFKHNAVCLGTMAVDTIKEVIDNKIIKTLDRKKIFLASTPQAFEFELIKKAHEKFKNNNSFTDDSSMIEALNIPVIPYITDKKNTKITTKKDLY